MRSQIQLRLASFVRTLSLPLTETFPLVLIRAFFALVVTQAWLASPVFAFEQESVSHEAVQQIRTDVRLAAQASSDNLRKQTCETLQLSLEAAETHAEWFETRQDLFSRTDRRNASTWKRRLAETIEAKGC